MKKLIAILCCAVIFGCTFQTKHRGYVFPNDVAEQIESVKTTAQLESLLGSPQVKTVYGDDVWVYFGEDENYRGPLPLTYDNKTVLLAWVRGTRVVKTQILHDDDLPNVEIDDEETEIPAAVELNALQELFKNVGRFSPAGLGQ
jgi:outer membrane protein assembly factor BamE (lipoprotein component of BamABCDE complex)